MRGDRDFGRGGADGAEDRAAGLKELADTERAFAKLSLAKGVAHSFHENFADDGIGFSPEPVN